VRKYLLPQYDNNVIFLGADTLRGGGRIAEQARNDGGGTP